MRDKYKKNNSLVRYINQLTIKTVRIIMEISKFIIYI